MRLLVFLAFCIVAAHACTTTITVSAVNQTCAQIASSQNVTVQDLYASNPQLNSTSCADIPVGTVICVNKTATTVPPTTAAPTTVPATPTPSKAVPIANTTTTAPSTSSPSTAAPTTAAAPTTRVASTAAPTTAAPTTRLASTAAPTTRVVTTSTPTTTSTTPVPSTQVLTTAARTSVAPTTAFPTTVPPTTASPTTGLHTTVSPTSIPTTARPVTVPPTTSVPTTSAPCPSSYIVQPGDSCYAIAVNYGISTNQLIALNAGLNCSTIFPGQVLCVPLTNTTSAPTTPAPTTPVPTTPVPIACSRTYSVQSGDSCYSIAMNNSLTLSQLTALNPGVDCGDLQIGQILCVSSANSTSAPTTSVPTTAPACPQRYTTQPGDYCYLIATNFGISVNQLTAMNPGLNCSNVPPGQVLCVPLVVTTSAPTLAPTTAAPVQYVCIKNYTFLQGDYCGSIAASQNISEAMLRQYNPFINAGCSNLIAGQILCVEEVPVGVTTSGPTQVPPTNPVPTTPNTGPVYCIQYYTVVAGDSCYAIATQFNLTVPQLSAMNPNINNCNLIPGQVFCVAMGYTSAPTSGTATPTPSTAAPTPGPGPSNCSVTYTVVGGDTCANIGTRLGVSASSIISLNPSINSLCTNLQVGQILCISTGPTQPQTPPVPTPSIFPPSKCNVTYTVKQGDSCFQIAQNEGISLATLESQNLANICNNLQVGTILCISRYYVAPINCNKYYTVMPQDTCAMIASSQSITTSQIEQWNPTINPVTCGIQAGQVICVGVVGSGTPSRVTFPPSSAAPTSHNNATSVPTTRSPASSTSTTTGLHLSSSTVCKPSMWSFAATLLMVYVVLANL